MLAQRGPPRDGPLFKLSHNAFHGKEELPQSPESCGGNKTKCNSPPARSTCLRDLPLVEHVAGEAVDVVAQENTSACLFFTISRAYCSATSILRCQKSPAPSSAWMGDLKAVLSGVLPASLQLAAKARTVVLLPL